MAPDVSENIDDADPDTTEAPCTVTVECEIATVGVKLTCVTAFGTLTVYPVVDDTKLGTSVPELAVNADRSSSVDGIRLTLTEYVLVVVRSWAVTTMAHTMMSPSAMEIGPKTEAGYAVRFLLMETPPQVTTTEGPCHPQSPHSSV